MIGRGWNARRTVCGIVEFVGVSTRRVLLPDIGTVEVLVTGVVAVVVAGAW